MPPSSSFSSSADSSSLPAINTLRSYSPIPPGASIQPVPSLSRELGLTQGQRAVFETDGYLVIPRALDARTVAGLRDEVRKLLEGFDGAGAPLTRFTTGRGRGGDEDGDGEGQGEGEWKGDGHVGDEYFLGSGDQIRFFFEEDAFDPSGKLIKPAHLAINKIGHYLHALSAPFAALLEPTSTHSPGAIARSLGFRDPRCLQSMVICKQPEIGGAVPPHQDSTFLYTDPPSAVGFWYALEDATRENGALGFLRGSHRWKGVDERMVRKEVGVAGAKAGTVFVANEGRRWPRNVHQGVGDGDDGEDMDGERGGGGAGGDGDGDEPSDDPDAYTMVEVEAGSLVLIHGNVLHKSEKNTSQKSRLVYTFHVIEAEGTMYDERNWLQPPEGGFTRI